MMRSLSLLMVGLALAWAPARALACQCLPVPIHRSTPKANAVDVPLNDALMVEGVFEPGSITLEEANGARVEFELNEGPWPTCPGISADLLPKAPLKPNTRYVIRVKALTPESLAFSPDSLSFTTGTTLHPDTHTLAPPRGAANIVTGAPNWGCGGPTLLCLGIDDPTDVELIARRGDEVLLRTTTLVQNDGVYSLPQLPDCVELRRRSGTGRRSEPFTICGEALGVRAHRESDSVQQVLVCRGGVIGREVSEDPKPSAPDAGEPVEREPPKVTSPDSGAADASAAAAAPSQHARWDCAAGRLGARSSSPLVWLWLLALLLMRTKPAKR